jgi:NTE family protein
MAQPRKKAGGGAPESEDESEDGIPGVALALQGGGSHGAFTWGVLDRLLEEVTAKRLRFTAVSGSSSGAVNAALLACGLAQGVTAARTKLRAFWESLSRRGALLGNTFLFAEPSPFGGWNIDSDPLAILAEATSLIISPYTNPFYVDALAPLLEAALPADQLAVLNSPAALPSFIGATNVENDRRTIFTQPGITVAALRASACLPTDFKAVTVGGAPYWDGGYLGNPPLAPLVDLAQDLLLILVNPFDRSGMPPMGARAIQERLNEITFNASLVLEINAIEAVNRVLAAFATAGVANPTDYHPVHFHCITNDAFLASLGFVSKNSTSAALITALFEHGRAAAEKWLTAHRGHIGRASSYDVHGALVKPVLQG